MSSVLVRNNLWFPPTMHYDEIVVDGQKRIVEKGGNTKLQHKALNLAGSVVSTCSPRSVGVVFWNGPCRKKIGQGNEKVIKAHAQEQTVVNSTGFCFPVFQNVVGNEGGATEI